MALSQKTDPMLHRCVLSRLMGIQILGPSPALLLEPLRLNLGPPAGKVFYNIGLFHFVSHSLAKANILRVAHIVHPPVMSSL